MTYKQAIEFAITSINTRIEELGAGAREAKESGDDETNAGCRNFQNGLIECADLREKLTILVEMTGGKPSVYCKPSTESENAPMQAPAPCGAIEPKTES